MLNEIIQIEKDIMDEYFYMEYKEIKQANKLLVTEDIRGKSSGCGWEIKSENER